MLYAYLSCILNEVFLLVSANEADLKAFNLVEGINAIFIAHSVQVFRCVKAIHARHAVVHEHHFVQAYLLIIWAFCNQLKPLLHHVEGLRTSDGIVSNCALQLK